jgi:hypothetical protein
MATNWAYWAGLFDGEGCIELTDNGSKRWALRLVLTS